MGAATLTSKGQTTIPKEIRDRLGLKPGDRLDFVVQDDGRVLMIPATVPVARLSGMLRRPKKRATLEEMDRAVRDAAAARMSRTR
jgi:antitoxin PrlF